MNDFAFRAMRPLSAEERKRSMARALADAPADGRIHVFAYGSLIWNPCFDFDAMVMARLEGYRRAFNFWTIQTRGTPERPGLGLGLEPGGACEGILYRLADPTRDAGLEAIWMREMFSDVYEPRWLSVRTSAGVRPALCFVTNPAHEQYAGTLDRESAARVIARACGVNGTCRDYLARAVEELARHGVRDPLLDDLLGLVDSLPPTEPDR